MDLTGLDFDEIDSDYQQEYDRRHDLARDGKAAVAVRDSMREPNPDDPKEPRSISALSAELVEFNKMKNRNSEKALEHQEEDRVAKNLNHESAEIDRSIREMEAEMAEIKQKYDEKMVVMHDKMKKSILERDKALTITEAPRKIETWTGTENIDDAIKNAASFNEVITSNLEYVKKNAEVQVYARAHRKCENTMLRIRDAKQKMIEEAKYPLPGMSVKDDQVIFKGMPFKDLSDGQKLLVSTSMAIALHPKLQVICLRNSQLLDSDNLQIVYDIAEKNDFHVWRETIETDDKAALHFVDGRIVENTKTEDLPR